MSTALATHLRMIDGTIIAHNYRRSARDGYARLQAASEPAVCPICGNTIPVGSGLPTSCGVYCSQACFWAGLD